MTDADMTDLTGLSWEALDRLRNKVDRERWRRYGDPEAVREVPTDRLLYILTEGRKHCSNAAELDCIRQELRRREGAVLPGRPVLTLSGTEEAPRG